MNKNDADKQPTTTSIIVVNPIYLFGITDKVLSVVVLDN